MEEIIEKEKCNGCMCCYNVCPVHAINIYRDKDGFQYPQIEKKKCIKCGICKKKCPILNNKKETKREIQTYACKNKDEKTRLQSSSGGIFSLLAEKIIKEKGVVFGVKFNENMEAVHGYIENLEEIELFRGSKYMQSQIDENYKKVKEFLEQNRKVLFTGTPCQIGGLKSYLGQEYENLYTQDIICHGVPSAKVWKKYLEYKKEENGEIPKKVNFRRKDLLGWSNYQINYQYSNTEENVHHDNDAYMKFFLRNFDLRQSCYQCQFKTIERVADITVADFWGINNVKKEINDEKGISAVLIHSKKGEELFEKIKEKIEFFKVNIQDIIKENGCICKAVEYNPKREEFFKDLESKKIEYLIEKYLK